MASGAKSPQSSRMPDSAASVTLENVAIRFFEHDPFRTLKHRVLHGRPLPNSTSLTILEGISFHAGAGERIGVIGANGSGKTTLLKTIAGILPPSDGRRRVSGSIAPIIAQGIGFNHLLSVRDNIKLALVHTGRFTSFNPDLEHQILEFSELAPRAEEAVIHLSSGQQARLSFAISLFQKPDILLLDEVFATGDAAFQRKATLAMESWIEQTPVVFLASHDDLLIRRLCERSLLLSNGRLVADGPTNELIERYLVLVNGDA